MLTDIRGNKPKGLFLEGGDATGKNELARSVAQYVLSTREDVTVLFMNFPQFWFLGHDIRLILRGACDDILGRLDGIENAYARAAMYALDRNVALLFVDEYLTTNQKSFVLSDRGPYSSCVTVGYLWAQGLLSREEVADSLVPDLFCKVDAGMFQYFDVESLLCTTQGQFSLGNRKSLDLYETEKPQKYSYEVYRMVGMKEIVTKTENGWRDRKVLAEETLKMSDNLDYLASSAPDLTDKKVLLQAYESKRLIPIGPNSIYETCEVSLAKKIEHDTKEWVRLSLDAEDLGTADRKELLDEVETRLAQAIKENIEDVQITKNPQIIKNIHELLTSFPIILELIQKTSGKKMLDFLTHL